MASPAAPLNRYRFNGAPPDFSAFANPYGDDAQDGGGNPDLPMSAAGGPQSQSVYGDVGTAVPGVNTGQYAGTNGATGIPQLNTDPNQDIHNMFYNDQAIINAGGQQINQEAQNQLKYYDPLQQKYQGLADQSLQDLKQTPGYTSGEASQINKDFGQNKTSADALNNRYLTSGEQSGIAGDPSKALAATYGGTDAEGKVLNDYEANLGHQVDTYGKYTGSAVNDLKTGLDSSVNGLDAGLQGANQGLQSGLSASQDKFGKLDSAVENPDLQFDPNGTEKQLSDTDVAAMKTAAGARVGNQYRSAQDDLARRAAAAGNTSPLAIGAARARLEHQSAADAGAAEAEADIAARQVQYQRAAGIEGQREGAVQTQAGMKASAATQEQKQAQDAAALAGTTDVNSAGLAGTTRVNAAGLAGTQGLAAAQKVGQAGIDAANTSGQTAINTRTNMTQQEAGAQALADQTGSSRAAALAGNRQATTGDVQNTQYGQGMATDQATSQGAQTTGNARIAGQGAYRAGVTGQQASAQQGGQKAIDQQQAAFSTQTGGINTSTGNRANYEVGGTGNSALNQGLKAFSTIVGHADGYVATEPEVAHIAEKGPEMVIPLPQNRYRGRMAA